MSVRRVHRYEAMPGGEFMYLPVCTAGCRRRVALLDSRCIYCAAENRPPIPATSVEAKFLGNLLDGRVSINLVPNESVEGYNYYGNETKAFWNRMESPAEQSNKANEREEK